MTAIQTIVLPATNTYPARIRASAPFKGQAKLRQLITSRNKLEGFCEMAGWPINTANVHRMAARLLCMEFKWPDAELIGGNLGEDYIWVFPSGNPSIHSEASVSNS